VTQIFSYKMKEFTNYTINDSSHVNYTLPSVELQLPKRNFMCYLGKWVARGGAVG
jgi:hypothetical protein